MRAEPAHARLVPWLQSVVCGGFDLKPMAGGASARAFFRVRFADGRRSLVVRASPIPGDADRLVDAARLFGDAGVNVPGIVAHENQLGFALMTDLGDQSYLSVLNDRNADGLIGAAIETLIRLQCATREGRLPTVDRQLLHGQMALFREWYLERHLDFALATGPSRGLDEVFATAAARVLEQPSVYTHGDYTARNLMVCEPRPGVLDFQDAMIGPLTLDVAALFWSSAYEWPPDRVHRWTLQYQQRAASAGLPVAANVERLSEDLHWTALQRQLRTAGVFARLKHRDNKPEYVESLPRIVSRIRRLAARLELGALTDVLDATAPHAAHENRQR